MKAEDFALRLSVIKSENFRFANGVDLRDDTNWREDRKKALLRDNNTCAHCGFSSDKYMEVHHLNGDYMNNAVENLMTLCPFCHSCYHIGKASVDNLGCLLVMNKNCDQAKLNRYLFELIKQYGENSVYAVELVKEALPVERDLGPEGLNMLANKLLAEKQPIVTPANYIFFPFITKYRITKYLIDKFSRKDK